MGTSLYIEFLIFWPCILSVIECVMINIGSEIGIIGLGLIGGTLALDLKQIGFTVHGYDPNSETSRAASEDGILIHTKISSMTTKVDIIFLAAPMSNFSDIAQEIVSNVDQNKKIIISDAGSSKEGFHQISLKYSSYRNISWVGGHPMAGTENSGYDNVVPGLFEGAIWALTVEESTCLDDYFEIASLVIKLGAIVVPVTSITHDDAVARISHIPYIFSAVLANFAGKSDFPNLTLNLAAGSFRDSTRVASSDPKFSATLCASNSENVHTILSLIQGELKGINKFFSENRINELESYFSTAKKVKDSKLCIQYKYSDILISANEAGKERLIDLGESGGRIVKIEHDSKLRCFLLQTQIPLNTLI